MTSWLPSLFQVETVLIAKFCGSRSRSDSTAASSILPTGMMSTWMSPDNPINQNPILVYIYQEIRVRVFPCASGAQKGRTNMFPWCPFRRWDDSGSGSTRVSQSQHFIRLFFFNFWDLFFGSLSIVCPKVSISSGVAHWKTDLVRNWLIARDRV